MALPARPRAVHAMPSHDAGAGLLRMQSEITESSWHEWANAPPPAFRGLNVYVSVCVSVRADMRKKKHVQLVIFYMLAM